MDTQRLSNMFRFFITGFFPLVFTTVYAAPLIGPFPVATTMQFPVSADWNCTVGHELRCGQPVGSYYAIIDTATGLHAFCGKHLAEDISVGKGSRVVAIADGIIGFSQYKRGLGRVVNIEHMLPDRSFFTSVYMHLARESAMNAADVALLPQEGSLIRKGDFIGIVSGNPNDNFGVEHLHLGIRYEDTSGYRGSDTIDGRTGAKYYVGYSTHFLPSGIRRCDSKPQPTGINEDEANPDHDIIVADWKQPPEPLSPRQFIEKHLASTGTRSLTVTKTGSGTITSTPAGIDCGLDCSDTYPDGTEVTVSIDATPGWDIVAVDTNAQSSDGTLTCFDKFMIQRRIGGGTFSLSCPILMSKDTTMAVSFGRELVVTKSGSGKVTSSLGGIDCGCFCKAVYAISPAVSLAATPDPGAVFTGWGGDCSGTGSCVLDMSQPHAVSATFTQGSPHSLTVSKIGTGTITSIPAGVDCGSDCSEIYPNRSEITVTVAAPPGSYITAVDTNAQSPNCSLTCFEKFMIERRLNGGPSTTSLLSCPILMDRDTTMAVTFGTPPPANTVNLLVSQPGPGTISSNPPGISCGANCSANFPLGSEVAVTVSPAAGWYISDLTTDATFTQSGTLCHQAFESNLIISKWTFFTYNQETIVPQFNCPILMDKDTTLSAALAPSLTVTKTGSGFVASSLPGIDCSLDCFQIYPGNPAIMLTATPNRGAEFIGWGGDCSGISTCVVDMTLPHTVTASFTQGLPLDLAVSKTGLGTITTSPSGISCGVDCLASYPNGTEVIVTATPDPGWYITSITTNATFTQQGLLCNQAYEMDRIINGGFASGFSCQILMEKDTTFSVNLIQR